MCLALTLTTPTLMGRPCRKPLCPQRGHGRREGQRGGAACPASVIRVRVRVRVKARVRFKEAAPLFLLAHHLDLLCDAAIGVKRSGLAYIQPHRLMPPPNPR